MAGDGHAAGDQGGIGRGDVRTGPVARVCHPRTVGSAPPRSVFEGGLAMIVTPSAQVAGHRVVRTLGLVYGNTIRARHVGKDILAGLKNLVGGEIQEYTKLMAESREQAIDRMVAVATTRGANAVIDVGFSTSYIMGSASEILVYGNAVVLEPETM